MDTSAQIAQIPLFEAVSPSLLSELAGIAWRKNFSKGQLIFSEGDEASSLYVLISGRVRIYKLAPDGKEQILHFLWPNEPFGEAAVFSGHRFPAYAEALTDCEVLLFPRPAFMSLIEAHPTLAMSMLAVLSRRLRQFADMIESLSLREVPGRLAGHLLYLSEHQKNTRSVKLDISKGQLANLLGTIPETLSRIISRMAKEGYIESTEGRTIKLVNLEGLKDLASGETRLA